MDIYQKPKIQLYVVRPFGDKLNVTFTFIKENFKVIFKFVTYFLLPFCLIQSLSINKLLSSTLLEAIANSQNIDNMDTGGLVMLGVHYFTFVGLYMIGAILMGAVIYGLMKAYFDRDDRLKNFQWNDFKPFLFPCIKRMLIMTILMTLIVIAAVIVCIVLAVVSLFTLIVTIPGFIACCVPLAIMAPIYLFEDISFGQAFVKTFRYGFRTWGGILLISIVVGIIANILQSITTIPWYITLMVKTVFATSSSAGGNAFTTSIAYSFMQYIFGVLMTYGNYLAMSLTFIALGFQYGHAKEKIDSVTVVDDIDNFDSLKSDI